MNHQQILPQPKIKPVLPPDSCTLSHKLYGRHTDITIVMMKSKSSTIDVRCIFLSHSLMKYEITKLPIVHTAKYMKNYPIPKIPRKTA